MKAPYEKALFLLEKYKDKLEQKEFEGTKAQLVSVARHAVTDFQAVSILSKAERFLETVSVKKKNKIERELKEKTKKVDIEELKKRVKESTPTVETK